MQVEGYVIGSCIKHIPLAGRDVTNFILDQLRSRGEKMPVEEQLNLAKTIKEKYCYVCPDIVKEYRKYDNDEAKYFKHFNGKNLKTQAPYTIDVGYERFLGPEIFFSPEIFSRYVAHVACTAKGVWFNTPLLSVTSQFLCRMLSMPPSKLAPSTPADRSTTTSHCPADPPCSVASTSVSNVT